MPAFTPEADRVIGDAWQPLRLAAVERLADAPLPTTDEEIWRYSRIGELDLTRFVPAETTTVVSDPSLVTSDAIDVVGDVLGDEAPDVFADANLVHARPLTVRVPASKVVTDPLVITHVVDADGVALYPRLVLDVAANAEITVVERFTTTEGERAGSLVVPMVQIRAGAGARVRYLAVNELGPDAWSIGHQRAVGERDSSITIATVALGADYARTRTDVRSIGPGASTRQVALYFATGTQMHDFRTLQDHAAPHTTSDLLFKGAVADTSRSVYTGLIKIRETARGTAANQTNRNLTLSEGAWAESVPNLEIETNDVRCSHASTVGPVDGEQRYYLESRGIRPEIAERLVVLGFFDEVITQLPVSDLTADLRHRVAAKLAGTDLGAESDRGGRS